MHVNAIYTQLNNEAVSCSTSDKTLYIVKIKMTTNTNMLVCSLHVSTHMFRDEDLHQRTGLGGVVHHLLHKLLPLTGLQMLKQTTMLHLQYQECSS